MTAGYSKQGGKISTKNQDREVVVAGCDLGKATAKFVLLKIGDDGALVLEDSRLVVHNGHPLDAFREWYNEKHIASCAALAATGLHSDELIAPVISELPGPAAA